MSTDRRATQPLASSVPRPTWIALRAGPDKRDSFHLPYPSRRSGSATGTAEAVPVFLAMLIYFFTCILIQSRADQDIRSTET